MIDRLASDARSQGATGLDEVARMLVEGMVTGASVPAVPAADRPRLRTFASLRSTKARSAKLAGHSVPTGLAAPRATVGLSRPAAKEIAR